MSDEPRDAGQNGPSPDPESAPNDPERTEPMGERTEPMGERTEPMGDRPEGQDWSRFDPFGGEREARRQARDAFDAARDAARAARETAREAAREAERQARQIEREAQRAARDVERDVWRQHREREREQRVREREQRDRDRQQRERESEQRARESAQRDRESEQRAREAQQREREQHRAEWRIGQGHGVRIEVDSEGFASKFLKGFVSDATGDAYDETVSETFTFDKMPRLRVRNISGATIVRSGEAGQISVVARKHVYASSEDRAKRLLQNLEIRMEKHGDELRVEPHLYEQERGWVDLFRGKRFRVDFEISVPRECAVDAQTVSGELTVSGIRGPVETQSVSGEIAIDDIEGPLRLKSVSGDVTCRRYVGHIEGNTVSGDVLFDGVRVRSLQLQTVSGDVELRGVLEPAREHRLRAISGDIDLALVDPDLSIEFRTASGDLECEIPAKVTRGSRKEYDVTLGAGRGHAVVKTVSGDLTINATQIDVPGVPSTEEPPARATEWAEPAEPAMDAYPPEPPEPPMPPQPPMDQKARDEIKGVLEKLAKGELGVDDAAAALDAARKDR